MLSKFKNMIFGFVRGWFAFFGANCATSLPEGPVLVIAPHPDDETVGCGAAISRFCAEGRKVRVVIVTDGRASTKSAIISPDALAGIRHEEALRASAKLGLSEKEVFFLDYPDSHVVNFRNEIYKDIALHTKQFAPAIIFSPHPFDEHSDHRATACIIEQLQDEGKIDALVFQYPIWYSIIYWPYGVLRCLTCFPLYNRCRRLCAKDFLAKKKDALSQYRSQFENITGEKSWSFFSQASYNRFCPSSELFFERFGSRRNLS